MTITENLRRRARSYIFFTGIMLDLLIGVADYLTGYSLSLSVLYLAPIGLVSWFINNKSGILMSLFCIATISVADYYSGKIYQDYLIEFWNSFFLLVFFLVVAILVSGLRFEIDKREKLILELQTALNEIRTLSGLLPICSWCKKIRDDSGYWQQVEHYVAEHSEAEFTHGICPECLKKISPESYARLARKEQQHNHQHK